MIRHHLGHACKPLVRLLGRPDAANVHGRLSCGHDTPTSVATSGKCWEIELTEHGDRVEIEVERLVSVRVVCDGEQQLDLVLAPHMIV